MVKGRTIDVHAHLVPPAWFGRGGQAPRKLSRAEWIKELESNPYIEVPDATTIVANRLPELEAFEAARADGSVEASAAVLVAEMDAAGIDTSVCMLLDEINTPFKRVPVVPIEKMMEDVERMASTYPGRIVNFLGVDPNRGAEGVALLDRAVGGHGFCGMGEWLSERWGVFPNDRQVSYPYFEACVRLGIPFANNGSGPAATQSASIFEQVVTDFPQLKIVHAAAGVMTEKELKEDPTRAAWSAELLALAERSENFFLDMDDWQRRDQPGQKRALAFLRKAMDGPARHRIMFGTDFPVFTQAMSAREWVDVFIGGAGALGYRFSNVELEAFFSANALRYLAGPRAPAALGIGSGTA
ncbi:MAG TPA: amidohydrolase family protein [Allosphingosinicella sp.]|nr:amidohydrolase family protein [Allosphingosinicella sp.]